MLIRTNKDLHSTPERRLRYAHLEANLTYVCLGAAGIDFRVVNSVGEPTVVDLRDVRMLNNWMPSNWNVVRDARLSAHYGPPFLVPPASAGFEQSEVPPEPFAEEFLAQWHAGDFSARKLFGETYLSLCQHYDRELADQTIYIKL
jgi:hypothetical protein